MKLRTALALSIATTTGACASGMGEPSARTALSSGPLATGEHEPILNGVRTWYRVAGRPAGVPVVYLAGGPGGNHYEFATIAGPYMESKNRLVYFDGRGTGRSERPASGDYRIATLVDDIEALRRHLGVPRIAVMGHSFAGILALEYAAKYPGGTAGLILVGGVWNLPASCRERLGHLAGFNPRGHAQIMANGPIPDERICSSTFFRPREDFERANDAAMFPIAASLDKQRATAEASGLKNTGELSRAVFKEGLLTYRFAQQDKVRAPVLVVSGAKDFAAGPQAQRELARTLPNARIIEYSDYGHWTFIDDPVRFAADVGRFLDGLD